MDIAYIIGEFLTPNFSECQLFGEQY